MNNDQDGRGACSIDPDPNWISLYECVDYLAARGLREGQAKVAVCDAIAEKRVRLRARREGGDNEPATSLIYGLDDVDVSGHLSSNRFDWANSRTAPLYPWRIRAGQSNAGWVHRNIVLVHLKFEDLIVELCNDLSSVRLPETNSIAESLSVDPFRDLQEIAQSEWSPSQATVDAVVMLADSKTISLCRAVSMMASSARAQDHLNEKREYAFLQQAARALCDAAWLRGVILRGSCNRGGEVRQISEDYFEIPRCLAIAPDSLERDYERVSRSSTQFERMRSIISEADVTFGGSGVLEGPRFDVEVDVETFSKWLNGRILAERQEEARRRRSRRLFNHPFWSIETTLCWIAFRDSARLKTRRDETESSLQRSWLEADSQPEIGLLNKLQADELRAFDGDQPVPKSYWEDCAPTSGRLAPRHLSLRLARDDVLRSFPARRESNPDSRTRREIKIERIAGRMREIRKWISCVEIAGWCMSDSCSMSRSKVSRTHISVFWIGTLPWANSTGTGEVNCVCYDRTLPLYAYRASP
jgi:hypothetical protein